MVPNFLHKVDIIPSYISARDTRYVDAGREKRIRSKIQKIKNTREFFFPLFRLFSLYIYIRWFSITKCMSSYILLFNTISAMTAYIIFALYRFSTECGEKSTKRQRPGDALVYSTELYNFNDFFTPVHDPSVKRTVKF